MKTRAEFNVDISRVANTAASDEEIVNCIHSLVIVAATLTDALGTTDDRKEPDFEHIEHTSERMLSTLSQAYEVNLDVT